MIILQSTNRIRKPHAQVIDIPPPRNRTSAHTPADGHESILNKFNDFLFSQIGCRPIIPPGFMFHTARVISMVFHSSGLVSSQPIAVAP
jgi:hypothetical protein